MINRMHVYSILSGFEILLYIELMLHAAYFTCDCKLFSIPNKLYSTHVTSQIKEFLYIKQVKKKKNVK